MTISDPDASAAGIGVHSAFTDYVKTLPRHYSLPTFFTDDEYEALEGTSLHDAVAQKRTSLQQEFEDLKLKTESIEWCRNIWWSERGGMLTLENWTMVDAMYRSRALDLPQNIGAAMVPLIDMANHMPDDLCNARFEVESGQRVQLLTKEGRQIRAGDEITINYGPGGACESIFSYGFLEEQARSARELFLSLTIPTDDPLRVAKVHCSQAAPGVRIYTDERGDARFESEMALWASINEEDGLAFELSQTTDGGTELQAVWNSAPFAAETVHTVVDADPRAHVFALRAAVMVQERVERQGELLSMTQDGFDQTSRRVPDDRKYIYDTIRRLRELELQLLMESYGALEAEVGQDSHRTAITFFCADCCPETTPARFAGCDDLPVRSPTRHERGGG